MINNCPITIGVLFFPAFVLTSSLFGFALSLICNSIDEKKSYFHVVLTLTILVLYSLLVYYFEPQLFLFNPIIVFFPGLVYNEVFSFTKQILIYLIALSISSILILTLYLIEELNDANKWKKYTIHLKIIPFLILSLLFLFADEIGLSTSETKLNRNFSEVINSKNFKIFFESGMLNKMERKLFLYSTEYHYNYLKDVTGYSPSNIGIYVFKDNETKKNLLGDEVADFTKPWLKKIFVTKNSFEQTIKHELAHIFLGETTRNIFKVAGKLNLGLIEGGAMALEWEWLENTPLYYAKLINRFIGNFKAKDFFQNYSFIVRPGQISYLMSGAFCKYLIDSYGIKKFLMFYRTADFEKVYNRNIEEEYLQFIHFQENEELKKCDSLKAQALFGGKSFIEKRCPRSLARMNKELTTLINNREFDKAEKLALKIFKERKDPDLFANLIRIIFYKKEYDRVISLIQKSNFLNKINGINSIRIMLYYGLSLKMANANEEANRVFYLLENINLSSSWNTYIELFRFLLEHPEYIDSISEKPTNVFLTELIKDFPQNPIILRNLIDRANESELDIVFQNSQDNFWIMRKCFFRYFLLGNFVKAKQVINILEDKKLITNEAEKYQLDQMKFILRKNNFRE